MEIQAREVNEIAVFDVRGELRRPAGPQTSLHGLVKSYLDRGQRRVLINLDGVDFIDSYGVGEILASYISTQNVGGRFKICGVSPKIGLIFKITKLDTVLDIGETCQSALESFERP